MKRLFDMAIKDLRILSRDKAGAFFIVVFPILMGLFFGMMMGSPGSGGTGKMKIGIVDQDDSEISQKFIELLGKNESLTIELTDMEAAKESVRKGQRVAMLVLPENFGEKAGVFFDTPPTIQLGVDPSRNAESAMLQGFIMEGIGGLVSDRIQNPDLLRDSVAQQLAELNSAGDEVDPGRKLIMGGLFGSLESLIDDMDALKQDRQRVEDAGDGDGGAADGFNFVDIEELDISRTVDPNSVSGQLRKQNSKWDISFPQAMMWGILGCVAGFAISIARERTHGTMVRLQAAPISRFEILAGKALACFLAVLMVIGMLTGLGVAMGMKPGSFPLLTLAAFCVAFCFVGIMMVMSVLGKTEQSVSGSGWAINMVMAMLGGCMIPVMFMPEIIQRFSNLSPIRWGILAIEGAIWRQFSFAEMILPCSILLGVGAAGMVIGTIILGRQD